MPEGFDCDKKTTGRSHAELRVRHPAQQPNAEADQFAISFEPVFQFRVITSVDTSMEAAMVALKLRLIGNSTGLTIPKETLAQFNLKEGDTLYLTPAPGGMRLTPYDPDFSDQMEAARAIMKKRRNALRELAK
jgi:putative addiction module antidote